MSPAFPYLTGATPDAAVMTRTANISQDNGVEALDMGDGRSSADVPPGAADKENFDDNADTREFVFPNLEQDVAAMATAMLARTRGAQRRLQDQQLDSIPTPARTTTPTAPATPVTRVQTGADATPMPRYANVASPIAATPPNQHPARDPGPLDSALVLAHECNSAITTTTDLYEFLEWQASQKGSLQEQARFKEDAFQYPGLLVFAMMRPKTPVIHLLHSIQTYPNVPGSDPTWKGKTIGFLGDHTLYLPAPQMVELKEKAPWAWESCLVCNDLT
jgi:hypothetical protein